MKIDNIFFKFLIVISILLLIGLVNSNISEMFQEGRILVNNRENMRFCNSLNSLNCDLKKCVFSKTEHKCNAINENLYTDSETLNEFYKENRVFKGLESDEVRVIENPTPFLSKLNLFKFNGSQTPGYIFISEFYGNNTSVGLFFSFNEFSGTTMPLITSDNWSVNIRKEILNEESTYYIEFNFIDDAELYSHPGKLEPGDKFYFFGMNLTRTKLTLYVMNQDLLNSDKFAVRYNNGETYSITDVLKEKVDTRTTSMFIGCNLERTKFFNGYIGKFDITKNQRTINDLKRLSAFFSPTTIDYNELDSGKNLNELQINTERDPRKPSKIQVSITLSDNIAELFWLPPEEGKDSISTYIIIMIIDEKDVKYLFYDKFSCQKCYKKIHDLEYNKRYQLNVIAVNDNGLGNIDKNDFILVEPVPPPPLVDQSLTGFSKNPDKIACNPDGTYNIGKSCFKNEGIVAQINDDVHDILVNHLENRDSYALKPNIDLIEK